MEQKNYILEEIELEAELHAWDEERVTRYNRWATYIRNLLERLNKKEKT